jgi:hypothetical protein
VPSTDFQYPVAYVNFGRESSKRFKQTTSSSSLKKMAKVKMRFDANELEELSTGTVNPAALRHKIKLRQMRLGAV